MGGWSMAESGEIVWSLGCDVTIEDFDSSIEEIKVGDISLSGVVSVGELPVDVDSDRVNVMDLDVSFSVDGVHSTIIESQVVPHARIVEIGSYSPEATNEKRYAASAYAAKKILDSLTETNNKVSKNENAIGNLQTAVNELEKKVDENEGGSGDSHWYLGDDGKIHIDYDIVVHGNALIDGDTASGGAGEDNPVGGLDRQAVLDLLEEEKYVTEDDIAGLIPEVDLSDYYTSLQVDEFLSKKANTQDVFTKEELNPYKSWWDKLMAHLTVDDNGNVTIDTNLIVSGDTASGGEGEDNPSGGGDLDIETLATYLTDNKYINADNLDTYGVATKSWVTEQGFAKASALSSYQPLSTAINTGNIGSQSVSHATTTNRFKYIASSGDLNTVLDGGGLARTYSNYMSNIFTNAPSGMRYGMVLQLSAAGGGAGALSGQLAWDVNHASTTDTTRYLWWRASDSTNGFTYGKWHQIAFTDSNVASATKLATARSIWGQSFDGTEDVSGALYMPNNTSIYMRKADGTTSYGVIYLSTNNSLVIGNDVASNGFTTLLSGNEVRLRYGTSRTNGLILNSSGNVGIGVDNPQYKLDVFGDARLYSSDTTARALYISNTLNILRIGVNSSGLAYLFSSKGYDMGFSTNSTRRMTITSGGNVGIGVTSPAYKLDVSGDSRISGNLIVTGDVASA